jgi:hypothetical protein
MTMAVSRLFAFAYVWAMGGNLMRGVQEEFDEFAREQLSSVANFPGGVVCKASSSSHLLSTTSVRIVCKASVQRLGAAPRYLHVHAAATSGDPRCIN